MANIMTYYVLASMILYSSATGYLVLSANRLKMWHLWHLLLSKIGARGLGVRFETNSIVQPDAIDGCVFSKNFDGNGNWIESAHSKEIAARTKHLLTNLVFFGNHI